ncbi:LysE family translocator [Terasakiella pusilla]|uniref:LysE family translocator n=1 Tax=Terasakiella pusilla TaxID=64973 RepID=UPI003AA8159F
MDGSHQIIVVATITLLAVISPGPDFAVITKNSIMFGRKSGIATAFGIATGVCVHITYTLLGLGYLLAEAVWLLEVMRYGGAAYLIWLGISAFRTKNTHELEAPKTPDIQHKTDFQNFRNGFVCNALNPKTALFFIALFTQVVGTDTPLIIQAGFGLFIALAHFVWFAIVALFLTHNRFKQFFERAKTSIERIVGGCLVGLGLKLAITE